MSESAAAATPPADPDACPACGCGEIRTLLRGSDRLYGTTAATFLVVECTRCGLIRLYPWPDPEELSRYYPDSYWFVPGAGRAGSLAESYRRLVLSDHVRFVWRAYREAGVAGPVLDVGCGGGLFLRMLAERGAPVVGLDYALPAASAAWNTNRVAAVCGSLGRSPIAAGSCSVVTLFHVLEHLYDPAGYLDEAHRILKPNGRLVVQVPNANCWQFFLFNEAWNGLDIPRHLLHFRESDLRGLVEDCGFEILRTKHFSWRDNPAGLATTLAPGLDPMARRIRAAQAHPPRPLDARTTFLQDLAYLGLTLACWPFALLEAACRRGSSIILEARKRP